MRTQTTKITPTTLVKPNTEQELSQLTEDQPFMVEWKKMTESPVFLKSLNVAFDEFKSDHSGNKDLPHVFAYNQAAIAGVRDFLETYFLIPRESIEKSNP